MTILERTHAKDPSDTLLSGGDWPEPEPQGDWLSAFELTEEEVKALDDPEWIIENLIIKGHLAVFPAEPNAGKTTIFLHLAGEMSKRGYDVIYVNADVAASDVKKIFAQAKSPGASFRLITPDLKAGQSMDKIVDILSAQNDAEGVDFSSQVWIFDTFKKMTDVINKSHVKKILKLFRSLTGKGMTVILLAHTNKYKDAEGKPIYEGTGDVRADCDELIYLIPKDDDFGGRLVSTVPDKVRGNFKPITFEMDKDRNVSLRDNYVDVAADSKADEQFYVDEYIVYLVKEALTEKKTKQKDIVSYCREQGISHDKVHKVIKRYTGKLWRYRSGYQNNTKHYEIITG